MDDIFKHYINNDLNITGVLFKYKHLQVGQHDNILELTRLFQKHSQTADGLSTGIGITH